MSSSFGEMMRTTRQDKGWSLLQLSREIYAHSGADVHPSQLSRIERGLSGPGAKADSIALVLGFTPPLTLPPELDAELGQRLKAARKAQRMTLLELAAKLHVLGEKADVSDLSKYERGAKVPGLKRVQALAGALGLAVSELFGDDAERSIVDDLSPVERDLVRAWRDGGLHEVMLWCAATAKRMR